MTDRLAHQPSPGASTAKNLRPGPFSGLDRADSRIYIQPLLAARAGFKRRCRHIRESAGIWLRLRWRR